MSPDRSVRELSEDSHWYASYIRSIGPAEPRECAASTLRRFGGSVSRSLEWVDRVTSVWQTDQNRRFYAEVRRALETA